MSYVPECYREGNTVVKKYSKEFIDRSRNLMLITAVVYKNKKNQEKEQVLRVEHKGKFIKQIHLDLVYND